MQLLRRLGGVAAWGGWSSTACATAGSAARNQGAFAPRPRVAACSRRGPRNAHNEDAFLVLHQVGLFAVSDGMGGHKGGRVASRIVIDSLREGATGRTEVLDRQILLASIQRANRRVYERAGRDPSLAGMGCTLALVWLRGMGLTCFHVGDSRVYRLREYRLQRLTTDHSGVPRPSLRGGTNRLSKPALTRALGVAPSVAVEVSERGWEQGDQLLLTTDGVTDALPPYRLTNLLVEPGGSVAQRAESLVRAAVAAGGTDDKTAVVIEQNPSREPIAGPG